MFLWKRPLPSALLQTALVVATVLLHAVQGDEVDDAVTKAMADLHVRGASVVFMAPVRLVPQQ